MCHCGGTEPVAGCRGTQGEVCSEGVQIGYSIATSLSFYLIRVPWNGILEDGIGNLKKGVVEKNPEGILMVNEVWESPCLSQFCRGSQGISSIDDLGGGLTGKNWFPLCTPSSPNTWACSLPHHFCYQKDLGRDNLGFYNLPALSPWLTPHGAQERSKIPLAWPEMLQPNGPIPTFPSSCVLTQWILCFLHFLVDPGMHPGLSHHMALTQLFPQ